MLLKDRLNEDLKTAMKEKKKRIDALSQFEKAKRKDLVEQTQKELLYINTYLPQPASEYEINNVIEETIKELNATQKEMGMVIKQVREKLKNRVDGKTISDKVKEKLNKNA